MSDDDWEPSLRYLVVASFVVARDGRHKGGHDQTRCTPSTEIGMRYLRPSSEAEMIACFLQQEYAHPERYGIMLGAALRVEGVSPGRLTNPDVTDPCANADRRRVLARYRGYGTGQSSYLSYFPDHGVDWRWVALTPEEVLDTRYIRYEYWTDLSAGTRSPRVAAARLRAGCETADPADRTGSAFFALAERLRAGLVVPPLILVSADGGETRVILEGHARVTAFALAPEMVPDEIEVILGTAPEIARWDEY
jgi:hypothetical protein